MRLFNILFFLLAILFAAGLALADSSDSSSSTVSTTALDRIDNNAWKNCAQKFGIKPLTSKEGVHDFYDRTTLSDTKKDGEDLSERERFDKCVSKEKSQGRQYNLDLARGNACTESEKDLKKAMDEAGAYCAEASLGSDVKSCVEALKNCYKSQDSPSLNSTIMQMAPSLLIAGTGIQDFTSMLKAQKTKSVCEIGTSENLRDRRKELEKMRDDISERIEKVDKDIADLRKNFNKEKANLDKEINTAQSKLEETAMKVDRVNIEAEQKARQQQRQFAIEKSKLVAQRAEQQLERVRIEQQKQAKISSEKIKCRRESRKGLADAWATRLQARPKPSQTELNELKTAAYQQYKTCIRDINVVVPEMIASANSGKQKIRIQETQVKKVENINEQAAKDVDYFKQKFIDLRRKELQALTQRTQARIQQIQQSQLSLSQQSQAKATELEELKKELGSLKQKRDIEIGQIKSLIAQHPKKKRSVEEALAKVEAAVKHHQSAMHACDCNRPKDVLPDSETEAESGDESTVAAEESGKKPASKQFSTAKQCRFITGLTEFSADNLAERSDIIEEYRSRQQEAATNNNPFSSLFSGTK